MGKKTLIGLAAGLAGGLVLVGAVVFALAVTRPAAPTPSSAAVAPPPAPPPPPPEPEPPVLTPDQTTLLQAAVEARQIGTAPDARRAADEWAADAPDISYAQLERNAARYQRERAVFIGRVLEIHDMEQGTMLRVATRGRVADPLWVETPFAPDETIVSGTRVRLYGYLMGNMSYESQAGWTITIPRLFAVAVLRR